MVKAPHLNLVVTLAACAVVFFAVGWYASPHDASARADVPQLVAPAPAKPAALDRAARVPVAPAAASAPVDVARLGESAMVGDIVSRGAAIDALARAPRDAALPALRRVLLNGDPATDRPRALIALRDLAIAQGDKDGRIRDAVREVVYHGDDETLASAAQDTLSSIEQAQLRR